MKIAIYGYYGFKNYGDDLFVLTTIQAARHYWKNSTVTVISPTLTSMEEYKQNFLLPSYLGHIFASQSIFGKLLRLAANIYVVLRYDMILYAGGSTLCSDSISIIRKLHFWSAKKRKNSFAAIGVSLGPYKNSIDEEKYRDFISQFSFLSTRDKFSFELAKKWNISPLFLTTDIVGSLPDFMPINKETFSKTLGVSLCYYEKYISNTSPSRIDEDLRLKEVFKAICNFAIQKNIEICIFCLNENSKVGDLEISTLLAQHLKQNNVNYSIIRAKDGVSNVWQAFSQVKAVFAIRLHAAITSYLLDKPFLLMEYHQKCSNFLDDINHPESLRLKKTYTCKDYEQSLDVMWNYNTLNSSKNFRKKSLENFTQPPWSEV